MVGKILSLIFGFVVGFMFGTIFGQELINILMERMFG